MNELREIWQGLGAGQNLLYLAIPLLAWGFRFPLSRLFLQLLKGFLKEVGLELSENLQNSTLPALQVIVIAFAVLVANEQWSFPEPYNTIIDRLLVSACVAAVFSVAFSMTVFIPQLIERSRSMERRQQSTLVLRLSQFLVSVLGVAAIMKVWGVDIGPALTGMGVAGAAIAIAAQDSVKNLIGGLNNAAEKRFSEGDLIRVDGVVEGHVESVDLRSTKIRRLDTAPVHVPNSELADCAVINFGRRPNRRIKWEVALTYDTDRQTLLAIRDRVASYVEDCGHFASTRTKEQHVRINALAESSIELLVYCFTRATDFGEYLKVEEMLALKILEIVEDEGGQFAFPSRSLYLRASQEKWVNGRHARD